MSQTTTIWHSLPLGGGGGGREGWLIPTIFSESYISWDVIACIYININRIHYCNCKIVKPPNSNCYHAGMTSPDTQLSETYSRSPPPPPPPLVVVRTPSGWYTMIGCVVTTIGVVRVFNHFLQLHHVDADIDFRVILVFQSFEYNYANVGSERLGIQLNVAL